MHTVVAVAIAMGIGTLISGGFERAGMVLPAYVGAMFAAALLRNLDDAGPGSVSHNGRWTLWVVLR